MLADAGADLAEIDQIIDDLLTVVRLDLPNTGVRRELVSIDHLLDRAAARFAKLYPQRMLEVPNIGAIRMIELLGEPALLRRAVDNLLEKTAKFSAVDTAIAIAVERTGDRVMVKVIDRGVGMNTDELAHAFVPFWRADHSRSRGPETGGVGLGLALVRRVARAHGGEATLVSRPNRGTTAQLDLPIAPLDPAPCLT